jgi:hypothetical protein
MSEKNTPVPQGVVAVLVGADGREIAHAADFKRDKPGGFTLDEAQRGRCKRALAMAVIDACASPMLRDSIEMYDAERIVQRLVDNGCRLHIFSVGYDGDEP